MPAPIKKYKAAAVQAEPGWLNLEESVKKTIHWINEAGKAGCKLVAFPEVWIPGYPYFMWKINYQQSLPLLKAYRENSLASDSDEMRRIREAARENGIYVSLGYSELDLASLYISQVLISPNGDVINHRRKIKPTHVEKLVYGDGAGDTFKSVTQTDIGRIGQLNCWENMNPFLKSMNVSEGEQVHIAGWPIYPHEETRTQLDPWTNVSNPNSDIVSPAYAIETGTYVLAPFQRISKEGVDKNTPPGVEREDPNIYNGNSRIFGPDGQLLSKADPDFEGLMFVEIDLDQTHLPKVLADFGGHYMRPDLIRLLVDTRRKELITEVDQNGGIATYSTQDRVGLSKPLAAKNTEVLNNVSKEKDLPSDRAPHNA
ncbi:cyanide hydratase protein [Rutstroemia sp. NJR-2017a WRK4]|nr:cyanide hydratase protein [Rutstroemia sp. NJR-2017a WRK4]